MNRIELAKSLGISRQMLNRHERAGRLTPEADGGFNETTARAQLESNVRQKRGGSPRKAEAQQPAGEYHKNVIPDLNAARPADAPSLAKIQQLHEGYKAKKTKIQVEQLDGTLISAKEAELAWANHVTIARNTLLSIPDMIESRFGPECGELARSEIRRALTELSS